jgi:hypothetical protein
MKHARMLWAICLWVSAAFLLETVEHANLAWPGPLNPAWPRHLNAAWPRPLRKASGFPQLSRNFRGYAAAEAEPQTLMVPPGKPEAFRKHTAKPRAQSRFSFGYKFDGQVSMEILNQYDVPGCGKTIDGDLAGA